MTNRRHRTATAVLLAAATLLADRVLRRPDGEIAPWRLPAPARWGVAMALAFLIPVLGQFGLAQFIYFQF